MSRSASTARPSGNAISFDHHSLAVEVGRLPRETSPSVLAEFDPAEIERQAFDLVNAYYERHGEWPRLVRLMGHNHFTATLHLNTPDDYLGRQILAIVRR